jgi:hypothetical protein
LDVSELERAKERVQIWSKALCRLGRRAKEENGKKSVFSSLSLDRSVPGTQRRKRHIAQRGVSPKTAPSQKTRSSGLLDGDADGAVTGLQAVRGTRNCSPLSSISANSNTSPTASSCALAAVAAPTPPPLSLTLMLISLSAVA